jgi:hypothetical protein
MKTNTCILLALALSTFSSRADEKWDISKVDLSKLPPASERKGITYEKDIKSMLEASCFRCHGADRVKGGLRLDSLQSLLKGGDDGKIIVLGDSKKSLLVASVAQLNNQIAMPPKRRGGGPGGPGGGQGNRAPANQAAPGTQAGGQTGAGGNDRVAGGANGGGPGGRGPGRGSPPSRPLTTEQIGLVRAWIDQGAK